MSELRPIRPGQTGQEDLSGQGAKKPYRAPKLVRVGKLGDGSPTARLLEELIKSDKD